MVSFSVRFRVVAVDGSLIPMTGPYEVLVLVRLEIRNISIMVLFRDCIVNTKCALNFLFVVG